MAEPGITMSAFAKLRGVARSTAHKWSRRGLIIFDGAGMVDVAASNAMLDDRPDVYRGGVKGGNPRRRDGGTSQSVARSAEIKETYLALSAQLKYERAAARLCEIDAVKDVIEADYAAVRERCLRIGTEAAAAIASQATWPNAEMCKHLIDREVIRALDELTDDSAYQGERPSS